MQYAIWVGFFLLIILLVILDLGVFHKKPRLMKMGEALSWSVLWITLALIFNAGVYCIYEFGDFSNSSILFSKSGKEAALQFFTGYLLEKSLSLDNIFVISLIFLYYKIPLQFQQRVLSWGILTATFLRGALIIFGLTLVHSFSWVLYLFGGFLMMTGLHLMASKEKAHISNENSVIKIAQRFISMTARVDHHHFFIREQGILKMTPLFLALLQIETADVMFAVDSIPAIFAVTLDPFIVFTSNIFALFGLRSLYFALTPLMDQFRYIKTSLAFILIYIGLKMLIVDFYKIPNLFSLSIILTILLIGVIASVRRGKRPSN